MLYRYSVWQNVAIITYWHLGEVLDRLGAFPNPVYFALVSAFNSTGAPLTVGYLVIIIDWASGGMRAFGKWAFPGQSYSPPEH